MGKSYKRTGSPLHKECQECGTVWCDDQIITNKHQFRVGQGYGKDTCPYCHKDWHEQEVVTLTRAPKRDKAVK